MGERTNNGKASTGEAFVGTFRIQQLIDAGVLAVGDGYRAKNIELASHGIPFARAGNIDGGFLFNDADCFPEADLHKVGDKISRPGDVVFTSKGTVGRFAYVLCETPRFVFAPQLCYWRSLNASAIDSRFLLYWMHGEEFWEQADAVKGQTDMADYVSLTDQRRMWITLPPLPEQRAIAKVLGELDDKIESNRRMNRTLEDLARGLFRSWFVDFDPVTKNGSAKAPTAPYGLFPNRLADSPLGPIPEGWRVGTVYEHADVIYGAPFASGKFNTDGRGLPLIRIRDLSDHNPEVFTDEEHPKGTRIRAGDIVVGMDGEFRAHVWRGPECWLNQRMCQFKPKRADDAAFVLYAIEPLLAEIERSEVGTTVIHLGKADIDKFKVVVPPPGVMDAFAKIAQPMLDRMVANGIESRRLSATRDALLPQLLSGEIRLGEVRELARSV